MSYVVTLRDGTAHKLDDAAGASLRDHWEQAKKSFPIRIGNDSVLSTQIVSIAKEKLTEADWIPAIEDSKRLEAKDRCRGQYSIQLQINLIAHDEGGRDWPKLIKDNAWREQTRQRLRGMSDQWCDYRANECGCEADYMSNVPRHNPERIRE